MNAAGFDVHQHLWPEALLVALRRRSGPPRLDGWTLYLDGEPPYHVRPADHDESIRAALDSDVARVAVSLSCPLGIEYLPPHEAAPLLRAWHDGAAQFRRPFAAWASVSHIEPDLGELSRRLDEGFVGVQISATELADPAALERVAPVLRLAETADRPVLVHPGRVADRVAGPDLPGWWPALVDYVGQMQTAWWTWSLAGRSQFPSLRICFAAGAGLAPLHHERLTARGGGEPRRDHDTFVDTSSYGRSALRGLVDALGPEAVVLGSDRPYAGPTDPELGPDVTRAIRQVNPARLLGTGELY